MPEAESDEEEVPAARGVALASQRAKSKAQAKAKPKAKSRPKKEPRRNGRKYWSLAGLHFPEGQCRLQTRDGRALREIPEHQ